MKRLLLILILTFSFQSLTKADDIRDFEIEGMSIGDSALDYFTNAEIKNGKRNYYKSNKFTDSELELPQFKEFQTVHINYRTKDKKYEIYAVEGTILYKDNIEDCYQKKDEIVKEISKIFNNSKPKDTGTKKHSYDKSGKSSTTDVWFYLKTGRITVSCYDWSVEMKYVDHLRIRILSKEFMNFLNNEAYN
jgi:hypothetical protein